MNSHNVEIEC